MKPYKITLHLVIFVAITFILNSCNKDNNATIRKDVNKDSCIIIGLLPTLDCIPFYMAREKHIYDSMGLNIKYVFLNSQMDMDKYLSDGKIHIGASDIFRTIILQNKHKDIKFLVSSSREWELCTNKKSRISKTEQLGDRLIAITRHSILDFYCDSISKNLSKNSGLLLKPQINNVFIRLRMLNENQIDAALLPYPQSLKAVSKGQKKIASIPSASLAGFAINENKIKKYSHKLQDIINGYNIALDSMKNNPYDQLPDCIRKHFEIDSIPSSAITNKSFRKLSKPSKNKINRALEWVKEQKMVSKSYTTDTLVHIL